MVPASTCSDQTSLYLSATCNLVFSTVLFFEYSSRMASVIIISPPSILEEQGGVIQTKLNYCHRNAFGVVLSARYELVALDACSAAKKTCFRLSLQSVAS
mmetsp:Transcript_38408/g.84313  ORF Transcript_38408/g.84313 Transcript_38408/m.84313 type:complete len:100 (-) Transcript_38408:713-1012(-)